MRLRLPIALSLLGASAARPVLDLESLSEWAFSAADSLTNGDQWSTVGLGGGDNTELSIWEQLVSDDHYSRLVKVLKWENDTIKDLKNTKDGYWITFLAPNNDALKRPKHPHHHPPDHMQTLASVYAALEDEPELWAEDDKGDDDDKKRRRAIFKKIVHAILQYHILPFSKSATELAQNKTFVTSLTTHDGALDGLPQRIHVDGTLLPPGVLINWYSRIVASSEHKNGHLHGVNHPLLPPGSIFDEIFFTTRWASVASAATQRMGYRWALDWGYDREKSKPGKPKFKGTPIATGFVPSNSAWEHLPPQLHFYLFTKFGFRALHKLLAFHYVPDTLLLSEYVHGDKKDENLVRTGAGVDSDHSFHWEYIVESALGKDAPLFIVADKKKVLGSTEVYRTTLSVNGNDVKGLDINARNGAWHIIDKVLVPPHKEPNEPEDGWNLEDGEWAGWEQWLPQWAEEDYDFAPSLEYDE